MRITPDRKPFSDSLVRAFSECTLPVLFLALITAPLSAQDNTLYFMNSIPQANQLNPALIFSCKTYIELPVISSVKLNVRNTGFGFHDAVHKGEGAQSDTFFLDLDNLDKKLGRMNYFKTDIDINLLGFGFALKDWFFSFGIVNHTDLRVAYPHDIVSVKDGNWLVDKEEANPLRFNGMGIDATVWNSIGVSAARQIMEGLTAGARLKYLQGCANINTRHSRLLLNTTDDPITLQTEMNYKLNASFPVQLGYDTRGLVDSVSFDRALDNIPADYIFNGNRGIALDAGIIYDIDEITQLSLSIADLGFIRWKKNVNNFNASGEYSFSGIDLDQYQADPDPDNFIQALEDSLMQAFTAEGTAKGYFTMISLKIFGGITREILPNLKAGVMTRTEIYDLRIRPSLTMSLNYRPIRALAASVSYTVMNNKLNQFGAGLALGNRVAQFYIITDNIPVRYTRYSDSFIVWPYNARMLSLRFGFNLMFGCTQKEDKKQTRRPGGRSDVCPAYW